MCTHGRRKTMQRCLFILHRLNVRSLTGQTLLLKVHHPLLSIPLPITPLLSTSSTISPLLSTSSTNQRHPPFSPPIPRALIPLLHSPFLNPLLTHTGITPHLLRHLSATFFAVVRRALLQKLYVPLHLWDMPVPLLLAFLS